LVCRQASPWPYCVRWGLLILPQRRTPPIFGPYLLWPNPNKEAEPPPQFSAHVYCSQAAGWIKMALGTEVDLGPGHTAFDGDPTPLPKKGLQPPIFGPFCGQTAGCIKMPGTASAICPFVLDGDPAPSHKKGHSLPLNFRPISIVDPRLINGSLGQSEPIAQMAS